MCEFRLFLAFAGSQQTFNSAMAGYDCEVTFEEFVMTNPLPQRAKVIEGYEYSYRPDLSFSAGDVIEVRLHHAN